MEDLQNFLSDKSSCFKKHNTKPTIKQLLNIYPMFMLCVSKQNDFILFTVLLLSKQNQSLNVIKYDQVCEWFMDHTVARNKPRERIATSSKLVSKSLRKTQIDDQNTISTIYAYVVLHQKLNKLHQHRPQIKWIRRQRCSGTNTAPPKRTRWTHSNYTWSKNPIASLFGAKKRLPEVVQKETPNSMWKSLRFNSNHQRTRKVGKLWQNAVDSVTYQNK